MDSIQLGVSCKFKDRGVLSSLEDSWSWWSLRINPICIQRIHPIDPLLDEFLQASMIMHCNVAQEANTCLQFILWNSGKKALKKNVQRVLDTKKSVLWSPIHESSQLNSIPTKHPSRMRLPNILDSSGTFQTIVLEAQTTHQQICQTAARFGHCQLLILDNCGNNVKPGFGGLCFPLSSYWRRLWKECKYVYTYHILYKKL